MKNLHIIIALLGMVIPVFAATPQEEIADKVPKARAIIHDYQKGSPTDTIRPLHIVYWTPADREPALHYRERLTRCLTHIQQYYGKEMERIGFGKQTINLEFDTDKLLKIHLVRAPQPYKHYNPSDGDKIRKECLPTLKAAGIDASKETIVIFCNMSNWDAHRRKITQNSPYYASGTHRNGVAWQVDSPLLDPIYLDKKFPIIHDGQYGKISLGKYNSIFVGGVAHELGHALGLPHNCERADERAGLGIALMGSGNRSYGSELRGEGKGAFLTLASGLRLASHPMFTGSVKGMYEETRANLTNIQIAKVPQGMKVTGKVVLSVGSAPVHAVLAYTDPDGGSNYDATTATAIPAVDGSFELICTDLGRKGSSKLRLIALHANGDATSHTGSYSPFTYPYAIDGKGELDLSTYEITNLFQPVVASLKVGDSAKAGKLLHALSVSNHPVAADIASRLLLDKHIHPEPAALPASLNKVALSDTTPATAKTGFFHPMYNRLPGPRPLLAAASRIYQHGIYAHAPAHHTYQLGGKWKKLTGYCGLADGMRGSVVFIIKADGKEIWRSPRVQEGQRHRYEIDLTGKNTIDLMVDDAGDGKNSDWGVWLEPVITR